MRFAATALCALILPAAMPAAAHRLDEYLQATTIAVEAERIEVEMRLAPGVEVFTIVFAEMDRDADGIVSDAEQQAYAKRVAGDVSLTVDGARLSLDVVSSQFAPKELLESGRGEIRIRFEAHVAGTAPHRRLSFENRHQSRISSYLVNGLVPRDPHITLSGQQRSYDQSLYHLDYRSAPPRAALASWLEPWQWTDAFLASIVIVLVFLGRRLQERAVS